MYWNLSCRSLFCISFQLMSEYIQEYKIEWNHDLNNNKNDILEVVQFSDDSIQNNGRHHIWGSIHHSDFPVHGQQPNDRSGDRIWPIVHIWRIRLVDRLLQPLWSLQRWLQTWKQLKRLAVIPSDVSYPLRVVSLFTTLKQ